ncbi:MAG: proprotein convertase P-domain-containing protein [Candidatus Poribacteria bacterium]
MKHVFENNTPFDIEGSKGAEVRAPINVCGVIGPVQRVSVTLDIHHTFTQDLTVSLIAPGGEKVALVAREGGSRDNFIGTTFDDGSSTSITNALPPFSGAFRPDGKLSDFRGVDANGTWTLHVQDHADLDAGTLNRWALALTVGEKPQSDFRIEVRFSRGLTASQRDVFQTAGARWSEIITGDLPSDNRVDSDADILIRAAGVPIDGVGRVLGAAGPTVFRPGSSLPSAGVMRFDSADLSRMEADGSLLNVIIHEMGHVLGIGTIWDRTGLLVHEGTANPTFVGRNAIREFTTLRGDTAATPVPVANTGGPGTRDAHWRETIFGHELMTGFLGTGVNPVSRMTIASLQDVGYVVDYDAVDPYVVPSQIALAMMGVGAEGGLGLRRCPTCGV